MAGLALGAILAGCGLGGAALFRRQAELRSGPATPFRPDSLVGVGPDRQPARVPVGEPTVLLYVSAHCPWCRGELGAWSARLAADPGMRAPWVVTAPDTSPEEAEVLLAPFAGRWMMDPTGAVGRSLGVRAVPFVAVLDASGVVWDARQGLSSPGRLAELAAILNPTGARP